ncbi:MAG: hypothetical protein ACK56I_18625, partial [bacterium]
QALHALQGPPSCTRTPASACTFLRPFSTVLYKTCAATRVGSYRIRTPLFGPPDWGEGGRRGQGPIPEAYISASQPGTWHLYSLPSL